MLRPCFATHCAALLAHPRPLAALTASIGVAIAVEAIPPCNSPEARDSVPSTRTAIEGPAECTPIRRGHHIAQGQPIKHLAAASAPYAWPSRTKPSVVLCVTPARVSVGSPATEELSEPQDGLPQMRRSTTPRLLRSKKSSAWLTRISPLRQAASTASSRKTRDLAATHLRSTNGFCGNPLELKTDQS